MRDTANETRQSERQSGAQYDYSEPLGNVSSGRLIFARGASHLSVRGEQAMDDLYRARFVGQPPQVRVHGGDVTISYPWSSPFDWARYALLFWDQQEAQVSLNTAIPWSVEIHGGISRGDMDLREMQLSRFEISGGVSHLDLLLPRPPGAVPLRVGGGVSHITIHRPEGVAIGLHVGGGVSRLSLDQQHFGAIGGHLDLTSPDYRNTIDRYEITIGGGASNIRIDQR